MNQLIRKSKRKYFFEYFDSCFNNVKKTWEGINKLIGKPHRKSNQLIKTIKSNNESINDEKVIANEFNNYFLSIAHRLEQQIPSSDFQPSITRSVESMFLTPVSIEEVSQIIGNLKNSASGLNKISTHLLKLTKDIISPPLAELINYSFFLWTVSGHT